MRIEDGLGSGKFARVDSDNRLSVEATTDLAIATASIEKGDAYQIFVPSRTLGGTAEHNILYYKNTSETRSFVSNKYWFGWNGGSTNYNRPCTVKNWINPTAPSANNTVSGAGNLNTTSGNSASLTVNYWDEVGTGGMTVSSQGTQAGEGIISQGMTLYDLRGSIVLGPGDSILISMTGVEVGEVNITIEGYFV